jgi:predicted transposase/invertase (TIGR01784 family)
LNYFCFCNPETGLCFKGIPEEIFTLELPKVPADSDGSKVWEWLQFLREKQKGEFEMIATANPEIRKAVDILYEISADEKVRAEYDMRQKAWMDRQSQFDGYYKKGHTEGREEGIDIGIDIGMEKGLEKGRAEGRAEGREEGRAEGYAKLIASARNFKALGISADIIAKSTGLSPEEIAKL